MAHHILCVDPDESTREDTVETLRADLSDLGLTIETAATVGGAEPFLTRETVAIITEYALPDGTGFEIMAHAQEACPDAGCILYTDTDPHTIDTTDLQGILTEYVGKGSAFGADRLTKLVRTTIESRTQTSYPVPQDEDERLAALRQYDLDNSELVSSMDRITDLAATHFDVHTASINIIEEHSQEYLACYGEATDWEAPGREDSVCTFTIVEDDRVMTVEDLSEDPRFESRSGGFATLGVRAYMGAKLTTAAGLTIGSLCVYDTEPRSFSAADEAYLWKLADMAMDIIELHSQADLMAAAEGDAR